MFGGKKKREVAVREYKDAKAFEKDAQKMTRDGWSIEQQSHGSTHMNVGRTMFTTAATLGLNMLTPKIGGASYTKGKITVTWARGGEEATKTCPQCAEQVLQAAKICKHCGSKF